MESGDQTDDPALEAARESSLFVGSLEKGLKVLMAFSRERRSMGLRELVDASDLDKSSAQRFTFTLHALGFLLKDEETKKYALSPRVLELGFSYLQSNSLLEYATPLLYEANRRCGETLNITELSGTEVVYVARAPGQHVISVDIFLGARVPAFASAPGRAMLAFLPADEAEAIFERTRLRKFTRRTVTGRTALMKELKLVREQGWALAEEQCFVGEISAAAPIFNSAGRPIAALNVSVPSSRWSTERVRAELVGIVVETARAISRAQGMATSHPWFRELPQRKPARTGRRGRPAAD